MASFQKTLRYYYWLFVSFLKKNTKILIISAVASFFLIFLLIYFFPVVNSILFKKNIKIGYVGRYTLRSLPIEILNQVSNPLLNVNSKGEIVPILIDSWHISSDNKTYTFKLKSNLSWSDGKSFSLQDADLKFTGIKTKIIDDKTVEFTLEQALSIFPVYLNKPIIKYPLRGVAGLYQVQGYNMKKGYLTSLSLSPNKEGLDYRTYVFFDNEDSMTTAYKKGVINYMNTTKKPLADFFNNWSNTQIARDINYSQIMTLFFNTNNQLLQSKDVRKAIAYATPDFEDFGEKASGPIPPSSWAYNADLKKYSYNFDKGKSLFDKNASPGAQLNFYTFYENINVAEKIKENLEKIGININLKVVSYMPTEFDLLLVIWNPPLDPDQYYFWHSTQQEGNITSYKSLKVDKLLEDGRKITVVDERKKIYFDFQKSLMEDLPAYFLYHPYSYTIERK